MSIWGNIKVPGTRWNPWEYQKAALVEVERDSIADRATGRGWSKESDSGENAGFRRKSSCKYQSANDR